MPSTPSPFCQLHVWDLLSSDLSFEGAPVPRFRIKPFPKLCVRGSRKSPELRDPATWPWSWLTSSGHSSFMRDTPHRASGVSQRWPPKLRLHPLFQKQMGSIHHRNNKMSRQPLPVCSVWIPPQGPSCKYVSGEAASRVGNALINTQPFLFK